MLIYQNSDQPPAQQVLVLSSNAQMLRSLWESPLFKEVLFHVCDTPREAIAVLDREPDVFLAYDKCEKMDQVLSALQERNLGTRVCHTLLLYQKSSERKRLLLSGGHCFLTVQETFESLEEEDGLLIQTLRQALDRVQQYRCLLETNLVLVDIIDESAMLAIPPILRKSDFIKHFNLGLRSLSQELLTQHYEQQTPLDWKGKELTPRQRQVCQCIAKEGLTTKETAEQMAKREGRHISIRTIERHRDAINHKLGKNKMVWIRYLQDTKPNS